METEERFIDKADLANFDLRRKELDAGLDLIDVLCERYQTRESVPHAWQQGCAAYVTWLMEAEVSLGLASIYLVTRGARISFVPILEAVSGELAAGVSHKYRHILFAVTCDGHTRRSYEKFRREWEEDSEALGEDA